MNPHELRQLIAQPEGIKLEFKKEFKLNSTPPPGTQKQLWSEFVEGQWNEFIKDIIALSNGNIGACHQPGHLIIGVGDAVAADGTRQLFDAGAHSLTAKIILSKLKDACDPPFAFIGCEDVELDGKRIIVITIPPDPHVRETTRNLKITKGVFDASGCLLKCSADKVYLTATTFIRRLEEIGPASRKEVDALQAEKLRCSSAPAPPDGDIPQKPTSPVIDLPISARAIVGRDEIVADWLQLLLQPRTHVLTLIGPGGMGKTRVALEIAHICATLHAETFSDGVVWIDASDLATDEALVHALADSLRLHTELQRPLIKQVSDFLHERKMLIVFDGVERTRGVPEVITALSTRHPGVKLLITSRQELKLVSGVVRTVAPLDTSAAVELFEAIAQVNRPGYQAKDDPDASQICAKLECVPLAVVLAASRIRWGSPQILKRIGERLLSLENDLPELPPRQRALRSSLDWSYTLLSEPQADYQALFQQLSVFAGGFEHADAAIICDCSDIWSGIEDLERHSLLQFRLGANPQSQRFFMMDALREYATEKLEENQHLADTIRQRHAAYFLTVAQQCMSEIRSPNEVAALRKFRENVPNIRCAMDYFHAQDQFACAASIALELGLFLQKCGFVLEAVRALDLGLRWVENADVQTEPRLLISSQLWIQRASLCIDQKQWGLASDYAQQALDYVATTKDESAMSIQIDALNILGMACWGQASDESQANDSFHAHTKQDTAHQHLKSALDLARHGNNRAKEASILNNLGLIDAAQPTSEGSGCTEYLKSAWQIQVDIGDARGQAETATNLGVLSYVRGQASSDLTQSTQFYGQAASYYRQALALEKELEHEYGIGRALYNLGEVASVGADTNLADQLFAAAHGIFQRIGSVDQQAAQEKLQSSRSESPRFNLNTAGLNLNDVAEWALRNTETLMSL